MAENIDVIVNKKWYLSKTIWVNAISFVAIIIQVISGNDLFKPEYQAIALSIVNLVLRGITKENITL